MAYPLCKLPGIGDGGREKDVVNVVRKKNDCLFPNNSSLWETKYGKRKNLDRGNLLEKKKKKVKQSTRMGFEPTRAEHNGLAVHRLNHSATLSYTPQHRYNQKYRLPGAKN